MLQHFTPHIQNHSLQTSLSSLIHRFIDRQEEENNPELHSRKSCACLIHLLGHFGPKSPRATGNRILTHFNFLATPDISHCHCHLSLSSLLDCCQSPIHDEEYERCQYSVGRVSIWWMIPMGVFPPCTRKRNMMR